jgi:nitroreductase
MEVFDAVRTVRAIRRFSDRQLPGDALARILEAGRLAASAVNRQPWHFIVVKDRQRIVELATHTPTGRYLARAPVAVVVAIDRTVWAVSDASRAIQNMMLVAWNEGIGSNWVGFSGMLDGVKPMLSIPEQLDVMAVVPFGYPEGPLGKGKKRRKPLSEVAHLERFGEPIDSWT